MSPEEASCLLHGATGCVDPPRRIAQPFVLAASFISLKTNGSGGSLTGYVHYPAVTINQLVEIFR